MLRHLAKNWLASRLGVPSTERALLHLKQLGFAPTSVIDVGANKGDWTRMCKRLWPKASVVMVEPLPQWADTLRHLANSIPGVEYKEALLGAERRASVEFHCADLSSSVLLEYEARQPAIPLPMTTMDEACQPAELLKLDVQGYELEVLKGGTHALQAAEVVVLEANALDLYVGVPLLHELVSFMAARNLVVYDVGDFFRRPLDQSLWCLDLIFVPVNSRWRASKRWQQM